MVNLFCIKNIYEKNKDYIKLLINNITYIDFVLIEDENQFYEYLIKNDLIDSYNIYIANLDEILLKRISTINLHNNFYILNIKDLLVNDNDLSYLSNYNINIMDSNIANVEYIKEKYGINFIYMPFDINILRSNLDKIHLKEKYGFIMVRHVNSAKTNMYWIESYKAIRKYYDNKIVIIDDNSNYDFVKYDGINENEIINCTIIQSEYPSRGEILGYYYYYINRFFEKAVIIHDSVFINEYIDFDTYTNIKFLWHFESRWFNKEDELKLITNINNKEILEHYYLNDDICGAFGVQSVITYDFLNRMENRYNMFNLLNYIDSRGERMNFERIFALIAINENRDLIKEPSIFGIIHQYTERCFEYSFDEYMEDKYQQNILSKYPIIKVWSGR